MKVQSNDPVDYSTGGGCPEEDAVIERAIGILSNRLLTGDLLTSTETVKKWFLLRTSGEAVEKFSCLFLSNQHQLIASEVLFTGTIDQASIYPREVVKAVLKHNAAAVIFSHNHPSGVAEPSRADLAITLKLKAALEVIDVRVLDHIVVGGVSVVSMAERGDI